jgi:hypothetical protein
MSRANPLVPLWAFAACNRANFPLLIYTTIHPTSLHGMDGDKLNNNNDNGDNNNNNNNNTSCQEYGKFIFLGGPLPFKSQWLLYVPQY